MGCAVERECGWECDIAGGLSGGDGGYDLQGDGAMHALGDLDELPTALLDDCLGQAPLGCSCDYTL